MTLVMAKLITLAITKRNQIKLKRARVHQKIFSSAGFMLFSFTLHSNFHLSSPFSSKSTHHRSPTSSRPVIFLTIQKSMPARMTTIYLMKKELENRGKTTQTTTTTIFSTMCNKEIIGWLEAAMTGNIGSCQDAYKFSFNSSFWGTLLGSAGILEACYFLFFSSLKSGSLTGGALQNLLIRDRIEKTI